MGLKLPTAITNFKMKDSELIMIAQSVHDKMLTNVAIFATPPVTLATFQTWINLYKTASAAAIKGSKAQTNTKKQRKQTVINALRQLAWYVNQTAQVDYTIQSPANFYNIRNIIALSGFQISKDPNPALDLSGITTPIVKQAISKEAGILHLLLRQYTTERRGTKLWQVMYRTSAIPGTVPVAAGPWLTQTFTNSNIDVVGLTSGKFHDYQVAAIPGLDTRLNQQKTINWTAIQKVMII